MALGKKIWGDYCYKEYESLYGLGQVYFFRSDPDDQKPLEDCQKVKEHLKNAIFKAEDAKVKAKENIKTLIALAPKK